MAADFTQAGALGSVWRRLAAIDSGAKKKGRPTFMERPVGEVLRGGGKILYIEGGAGFALGCCGVAPVVFVIRRTFTRRLAARPSRVLFSSTGLSLPSPIT